MRHENHRHFRSRHAEGCARRPWSAADAARKLYAVSFKAKTSSNSTDRLSKYLARFNLKFKTIRH